MASNKARKRAKRRKNAKSQGVPAAAAQREELPRPLRLVLEGHDRLFRYMRAANGDPAVAEAATLSDVDEAVRRIAALAAPFDAFDVLENLRLSQWPLDPETYQETEHEGSAAAIELGALVLAARGHRLGTLPDKDGHRARTEAVMEAIVNECSTALELGSLVPLLRTIDDAGQDGAIQLGALSREIHVRNLSYTHMVEETIDRLFDNPIIEQDCRDSMGCSVPEIRSVFAAIQALHVERWRERMDALQEFNKVARVEMGIAKASADYAISPKVKKNCIELWDRAWADPADVSVFRSVEVAKSASLDEATVDRVVDVFSYDMVARDPRDAVREFFEGRSPFRLAPLLREPNGSWVAVHIGLLIPAIQQGVEQKLKDAARFEPYAKHRGEFLEQRALDLLQSQFPDCVVHRSFEYFVPNPAAVVPEVAPQNYTKVVEADGLLIVDGVALILEAKAGALTALSRTGDPKRLASDLRKIVTEASEQADRLRDRIVADRGLRLRDGSWMNLEHVREIHTVAVSLEDLSGIATVTSELVRAGLLSTRHLPWTISVHDLRVICELVERPAELLLYIRRRTEPYVTRKYHAVDELDFFLEFYSSGLYVEPDPDRRYAELPQLGEPTVAARRKFKRQTHELLTSRTDQLDAWYFYQLGTRQTPAPKPRLNVNRELAALVDALAIPREEGWLRIGATLLDADASTQRKFGRYSRDLADRSNLDGEPHSMTAVGGTRADDSFVLVWATTGRYEPVSTTTKRLTEYLAAKKHQLQLAWGGVLLFDYRGPMLLRTIYDNRAPGEDRYLDDMVAALGLRPVERMTHTQLRAAQPRPTRNSKKKP